MENTTIAWGAAALLVLATGSPMDVDSHLRSDTVNTDRMLDVSVSIRTISHVTIDRYGDSVWSPGSGSGLMVSAVDCEVWTNHHVIENAAVIEVLPRGWEAAHGIPARVVNSSPRTDVAILRMAHCDGIPEAKLGDSSGVRQGDEVYAVGNPLGSNPDSISRGIISHLERYLTGPTGYLQTDATINPGNSGGALFDHNGEVIGISTAIATNQQGSNTGIGYAIPINRVRSVIAQLRLGPPSWGDAGIGDIIAGLTAEEAEIFQVPVGYGAVNITETPQQGPSSGKLFARDVIYRINNVAVTSPGQVKRTIGGYAAGEVVTFDLVRGGKTVSVDIKLSEGWEDAKTHQADDYSGLLGMELEMWNEAEDPEQAQFKAPIIRRIHSKGPAHRGYIVSTQRAMGSTGGFIMPYLLSVSSVTGVVIDGAYSPVGTIEALNELARSAYQIGSPLLLEIETWRRNPQNLHAPLAHITTAFYRVMPSPSALAMADHPGRVANSPTPDSDSGA
ncbi:MAG: trypsin-like peptidase domain-containing protein [Gammaproteobacteria bacterium]|nr:trypsin-like peptidase domain-containing protein [Gammaproteobacteria bacterium]